MPHQNSFLPVFSYQRVLLPMNFWDLLEMNVTPAEAFELGNINPKPNE